MPRILVVSSEPIRPRMAGIGVRYVEFARRLAEAGLGVRLVSPASATLMDAVAFPAGVERRTYESGALGDLAAGCDAVIAQGQLANDVVLGLGQLPIAIDLYDPWLIENFHYAATLGLDPYRNDHASWVLQMSRGDFFLCSSEDQRLYYLGLLTALGRVHPRRVPEDAELKRLIAVVPFGVPDVLPAHQPVLPIRTRDEERILFGGLYDWYDPWPLLEAVERKRERNRRLILVRNPNAESTPQGLFAAVESWCRARGLWGEKVVALDWVEADRRFDLLRDVDVLAAPHRPSLETTLSLRTRFLEALAVGCPCLSFGGGALSRLLANRDAGWVVAAGDPAALETALDETLDLDGATRARRVAAGRELAREFLWDRALEPLLAFCRVPWRDESKEDFAVAWPTRAPSDSLMFRARRRLSRLGGGR
jgi:glycosyltransferase involved in cell wall biosynthesis